jgi:hypothetical protein
MGGTRSTGDQPRPGQLGDYRRLHGRVDPLQLGELGQSERSPPHHSPQHRQLGGGESGPGLGLSQ